MDEERTPLHLQFFNAMMRLKRTGRQMPPPCKELSHFEFMCLNTILDYGREHPELPGLKASQLSQMTQTSRPAMSQHINALEEKGFLIRNASKTDRRVTYLSLTQKGIEFLAAREADFQKDLRCLCDRLGHEDTEHLILLFNRLADILTQIRQEPEGCGKNHLPERKDTP